MHVAGFYKGLKKEEVAEKVKEEGFYPVVISDPPGRVYPRHNHPETKLLAIIAGSMEVVVEDEKYKLRKGDKLIIPGNLYHSATAGKSGCKFFWSEKIFN